MHHKSTVPIVLHRALEGFRAESISLFLSINFSAGSVAIRFGNLGRGDDLILLDRVACTGNESNLNSCPRSSTVGDNFCTHLQDAGVICVGMCT